MSITYHRYQCRCDICLAWWALAGPVEVINGQFQFGPFGWLEILATGEITEEKLAYWNELFHSNVQMPNYEINADPEAVKQFLHEIETRELMTSQSREPRRNTHPNTRHWADEEDDD